MIDADRAHYDGISTVVPDAYLKVNGASRTSGTFTAYLPAQPLASQPAGFTLADYPQGEGYATVTVSKGGIVTLAGVLSDGTPVTASAPLSKANSWPLFAQLYSKGGFLSGLVGLDSGDSNSDMQASGLRWYRPFMNVQHYPFGWPEVIRVNLSGARYAVPADQSVLRAPGGTELPATSSNGNARLTLDSGKLATPFVRKVNISNADAVTKLPVADSSFTLGIARTTGAFSGVFLHPDGTRPSFQGVIYQKGTNAGGHGYFLTTSPKVQDSLGESGGVMLMAQP